MKSIFCEFIARCKEENGSRAHTGTRRQSVVTVFSVTQRR